MKHYLDFQDTVINYKMHPISNDDLPHGTVAPHKAVIDSLYFYQTLYDTNTGFPTGVTKVELSIHHLRRIIETVQEIESIKKDMPLDNSNDFY